MVPRTGELRATGTAAILVSVYAKRPKPPPSRKPSGPAAALTRPERQFLKGVTPLYDSEGRRILTERECRELLGTAPVGRIVFTDRALPAIQPVSFAIADGEVVILTPAGSKLAAAARNAVVAFETDEFDPNTTAGWSVVVIGRARVVANGDELDLMRTLPLTSWAPGEPVHYIAITPELISGHRLPEPSLDRPTIPNEKTKAARAAKTTRGPNLRTSPEKPKPAKRAGER